MSTHTARPANEAIFSDLADGVQLMQASFGDHAFERHSHEGYAIGITTYGVQSFRCKGQRHDSQAGDFVLFNPDQDHDGNRGTDAGFRYTIWYVPQDLVASCLANNGGWADSPYFANPHVTDRPMTRTFAALSASLAGAPNESLRAQSLMRSFLGAMLRRHGEKIQPQDVPPRDAHRAGLARVKDYIRTYYQRNLTVSELAGVAGLSRAHLTRAFGAAYHVPPHVYLNAIRIARAQDAIRHGVPLATVALDCGFADQAHLSRRFKGSVGVTPSHWRQMVSL